MVDRVKPLGMENPSTGGTEANDFPTELNPLSDYVATKGIAFENSDSILIYKHADGDLGFKDSVSTTFTKFCTLSYTYNYFAYAESLGVSSTTNTAFQTKVTLSTGSVPAGNYIICWSFGNAIGAADKQAEFRVQLDGSTVVFLINPEHSRKDVYFPAGGSAIVTLTAATHSFTLQYRDVTGAPSIKDARLHFWRVS